MNVKTLRKKLDSENIRYPNYHYRIGYNIDKYTHPLLPYKIKTHVKTLEQISEYIHPEKGRNALIIGPGLGTETVLLYKLGYTPHSVELEESRYLEFGWKTISEKFQKLNIPSLMKINSRSLGREKLRRLDRPYLMIGDASDLFWLSDNSMDIAFSFHTGDSQENDWNNIYEETHRVLKKRGHLMLTYSPIHKHECGYPKKRKERIAKLKKNLLPLKVIAYKTREEVDIFINNGEISYDREIFVAQKL